LKPKANSDLFLDLLYGPAYHRLLQGHLALDDRFVKGVVRTRIPELVRAAGLQGATVLSDLLEFVPALDEHETIALLRGTR
jgi:hypothetical protein